MSAEHLILIEAELTNDAGGPRRQELESVLAGDAALRSEWIAHRRLAIQLAALRPRTDLAQRVALLIAGRRPSRRTRMAGAVRARIARRRTDRSLPLLAAAAVLLAAVAIWWLAGRGPTVAMQDGRTVAVGSELGGELAESITWSDGSRADLAPGTAVVVEPDGLRLVRGEVSCSVAPRPGDPFRIATRHGDVVVVGTRFDIAVDAFAAILRVDEGRVAAGGRTWPAGSRVRIVGGAAIAEEVLWRWPGDGTLSIGSTVDGTGASGVWTEDGRDSPCLRVDISAPGWRWRPGLSLIASIRSGHGGTIRLQCWNTRQAKNHAVDVQLEPRAGWQRVRWNLDGLRPYDQGAHMANDDPVQVVLLITEHGTPAFAVGSLEVVGP